MALRDRPAAELFGDRDATGAVSVGNESDLDPATGVDGAIVAGRVLHTLRFLFHRYRHDRGRAAALRVETGGPARGHLCDAVHGRAVAREALGTEPDRRCPQGTPADSSGRGIVNAAPTIGSVMLRSGRPAWRAAPEHSKR